MATYFFYSPGTFINAKDNDTTNTGVLAVALRFYGEVVGVDYPINSGWYQQSTDNALSGTPDNGTTGNTRSPSTTTFNVATGTNQGAASRVIIDNIARCKSFGWTSNYRCRLTVQKQISSWVPNSLAIAALSEGIGVTTRKSSRRHSKSGGFAICANSINLNKKTGSGSYELITPSFDNELLFHVPSDWQNGSAQSDTFNINLFPPVAPITDGKGGMFFGAMA